MKRNLLMVMCILVCIVLVSAFAYAEAPIKMKYSNYLPATHPLTILGDEFCKEINKRTGGRVEVMYYPGGILTKAPQMIGGVEHGTCDIGLSHIAYSRGRFPVTETLNLPLGYTSAYLGTQVMNDFYEKFKPKEWDSVHVLYFFAPGPQILATKNKPVYKLEDLKGLKIRGAGRLADVVAALGGTPVGVPMMETYDGLRRGIVDGIVDARETWKSWKLGELVNYATLSFKVGMAFPFYVVMNNDKWGSLPDDIKKIITEISLEWKDKTGLLMNKLDGEGVEFFKSKGGKLIPLSSEESARWVKAAEPAIDKHIQEMEAKGFSKADVESYLKFIEVRVAYWSEKEK